jgi:uncharacterized protein (TIGR03435 family)
MPATKNRQLSVAVLADCAAEYRLNLLKAAGEERGITVKGFATTLVDAEALENRSPDLVIVYPWNLNVLVPLWTRAAMLDETVRAETLEVLKDYLTVNVRALAGKAVGRLILVHGLASPPILPSGRLDFRSKLSYRRIYFEINEHLRELVRDHPNMFFVDEEAIFSNIGKHRLMENAPCVFADYIHSGRAPMMARSREYLNLFAIWSGRGKIKCIVTDLDNTLWPGEIGEGAFPESVLDVALGDYGGLHEALRLAKDRGVLLATCSKNTESNVLPAWRKLVDEVRGLGLHHLLEPDDFVIHKINWERKSENVRAIASALGFADDAILFLDDHAVEREDVHQALPAVTVIDSRSPTARRQILSDPRLENATLTPETQARTETTRAQLRREEERRASVDEASFLRGLRIKLRITRLRTETKLNRVAELIQRTHQFNITQPRHDFGVLRTFLSSASIYTLEVADRFTDYGLIGACIIKGGEVDTFVMSCRVLGLKVETAFLVSALKCRGLEHGVRGRIVETERNQPCRQLFVHAGFAKNQDGTFRCGSVEDLTKVDPEIYEITLIDEELPDPAQTACPAAVARVKQNNSGSQEWNFNVSADRELLKLKVKNASIRSCIETAYEVSESQIAGPDWLGSHRYDIVATKPSRGAVGLTKLEQRQMLREVLVDDFRLAFHRETKELPVYELVPSESGPKLQASQAPGPLGLRTEHSRIKMNAGSMSDLAAALTFQVNRPIFDRTGLEGLFDVDLKFGGTGRGRAGTPILAALDEQLGLKLEPTDRPVEIFVVDHVERIPVS